MRIVVAMSGGVDSSVAAALLAEQGHDVIGLSMQLYPSPGAHGDASDGRFGSCCTLDDLNDARRVASAVGFPHYILNFEQRFQETVISDFVREYATGRTPLPCAHCNSDLKFSTLLDRAVGFGATSVATGHYARTGHTGTRWVLKRSVDREKDQSYFLFSLTQDQLASAMFPVGALTKAQVRREARRLSLQVADKPDSQEICFVPDGDYASFVSANAPHLAHGGAIVAENGERLGTHSGIHRFTIGQRKGLGVSAPAPLYVLRIDADSGVVTVGPKSSLERTTLTASNVNWVSTDAPATWLPVDAQIRHRHVPASARVRALDGTRAEVEFHSPQSAVTPGQAVVFYQDDVVVGGGWIEGGPAGRPFIAC